MSETEFNPLPFPPQTGVFSQSTHFYIEKSLCHLWINVVVSCFNSLQNFILGVNLKICLTQEQLNVPCICPSGNQVGKLPSTGKIHILLSFS